MEEEYFKNMFKTPEIKDEYEQIKSINEEYFMIIKEYFKKIKPLEKYLYKETIKGIIILEIDNISRIVSNLFTEVNNGQYREMKNNIIQELLNILFTLKKIIKVKDNESLEELKNYYLSIRFLTYYYKLLMYNYSVKINEMVNEQKGIYVVIPSAEEDVLEGQKVKNKIREYYEVRNGKSK